MCNLCTKFVKFLEIGKQFSEDLVAEGGNVHRPAPVPRFSDLCAELWLLCLPRKVRLTFPRRVYTTSTIWRILSRFTAIAVSSETRSTLAQKSNLTFLRRPTLVRPLRAHARIHHIVRVFCLQSFTSGVKCLSFSALWVKAKGKFAFTAERNAPFLGGKNLDFVVCWFWGICARRWKQWRENAGILCSV